MNIHLRWSRERGLMNCLVRRAFWTTMYVAFVALIIVASINQARAGDYCLGDWTQTEQEYCNGHMLHIRALVADRDVGRPKDEVLAEAHKAAATYIMPIALAQNYVEYVYGNPGVSADTLVAGAFGGCIEAYEAIIGLGKEELGITD